MATKKLKFDYKTITSFEIACEKENIDPKKLPDVSMIPEQFRKAIISTYKLFVIAKAVNNGYIPDYTNLNQEKWFPVFRLSSGFGFVCSDYNYTVACAGIGSCLCFENKEKSDYVATQFINLYKDLITLNN